MTPGPTPRSRLWHNPAPGTLETAILWTLAYADIFDYALTSGEIHRYLVGKTASVPAVQNAVNHGRTVPGLARNGDHFTLSGRERLAVTRCERASISADLWPTALHFGALIGRLPFVRMVAVTGALSVDNATAGDDIDYLIVTEVGRLWLCRAMIIQLVVKPAAGRGTILCPNYVLTERAFRGFSRNLFTAHEIVQMVPVTGHTIYRRMCQDNRWVARFLPNAYARPRSVDGVRCGRNGGALAAAAEAVLQSPVVDGLERWEMTRKIRRFQGERAGDGEASFGADWCKGHFESHGRLVREALDRRIAALGDGASTEEDWDDGAACPGAGWAPTASHRGAPDGADPSSQMRHTS